MRPALFVNVIAVASAYRLTPNYRRPRATVRCCATDAPPAPPAALTPEQRQALEAAKNSLDEIEGLLTPFGSAMTFYSALNDPDKQPTEETWRAAKTRWPDLAAADDAVLTAALPSVPIMDYRVLSALKKKNMAAPIGETGGAVAGGSSGGGSGSSGSDAPISSSFAIPLAAAAVAVLLVLASPLGASLSSSLGGGGGGGGGGEAAPSASGSSYKTTPLERYQQQIGIRGT